MRKQLLLLSSVYQAVAFVSTFCMHLILPVPFWAVNSWYIWSLKVPKKYFLNVSCMNLIAGLLICYQPIALWSKFSHADLVSRKTCLQAQSIRKWSTEINRLEHKFNKSWENNWCYSEHCLSIRLVCQYMLHAFDTTSPFLCCEQLIHWIS